MSTGDAVDQKTKPSRLEGELLYLPQLTQSMLGMKMGKKNNNGHASIQTSMKGWLEDLNQGDLVKHHLLYVNDSGDR